MVRIKLIFGLPFINKFTFSMKKITPKNGCIALMLLLVMSCSSTDQPRRLEVLFLGHNSEHHNSAVYMPLLATHVAKAAINITYTENLDDLNKEYLNLFDGIIIYANHDSIATSQEAALLEFVRKGKGLIALHAASHCFRNAPAYLEAIGGQFDRHGFQQFTAQYLNTDHVIMKGLRPFETRDETYVHKNLSDDLTLLMTRKEGDRNEPWTWIRKEGKGRVFYTAYGHDKRTWEQPEFLQLVENGIFWSIGETTKNLAKNFPLAPLTYTEAVIPNYEEKDPAPKLQTPLSPEASMTHMQVPPGFKLSLFAHEPMIINPIHMDWDHKGRLWVIETVDYPNEVHEKNGVGDDKIKILEDTDGDGKADKMTVFADHLNIPTSFVFVNGGILLAQAPHFLFLADSDDDDIADIRTVINTGWGVSDTHAGPSNLSYGFDNKIWGTVGYSGFNGSIGSERLHFDQAVYNLTTDYKKLTVHTMTTNNTWGLGFNENNDLFVSTANNTHSAFVNIPQKVMRRVTGFGKDVASKLDGHYSMHPITNNYRQVDVFGGFTAAAGHNFYTARSYPKEYWNKIAFIAEPTGHLLHRAILESYGSGFIEKDGWNLLASSDEWTAPIQGTVGPDGNVWIIDWYNFIVQHNPTPKGFKNGKGNAHINPLRDKTHGRIYRLIYLNNQETQVILDPKKPLSLLNGIKNSNLFWRLHAQRLIIENQYDTLIEDLLQLITTSVPDEININAPAIHAIWTLNGLNKMSNFKVLDVVYKALRNENAGVRKAALQALPDTKETLAQLIESGVFYDPDLNTRLAAFIKSIELPNSLAMGKIIYLSSRLDRVNQDLWLSKALQASAFIHQEGYLSAYYENEKSSSGSKASLSHKIKSNFNTQIVPLAKDGYEANVTDIKGKEIQITGKIWVREPDALESNRLLAHGDKNNGYALYRDRDHWRIVVNQEGKSYQGHALFKPSDWFGFEFTFQKNGLAKLEINDFTVLSVQTPGLFSSTFTEGIRVGMGPNEDPPITSSIPLRPMSQELVGVIAEFREPDNSSSTSLVPDFEFSLKSIPLKMQFSKDTLVVSVGKTVSILFENPDFMQHNLLIVMPGKLEVVGQAADALMSTPDAAENNYVPQIPEVLFTTRVLNPNERVRLTFKAPSRPGAYPFVCTFPGHWRIMNGILIVK